MKELVGESMPLQKSGVFVFSVLLQRREVLLLSVQTRESCHITQYQEQNFRDNPMLFSNFWFNSSNAGLRFLLKIPGKCFSLQKEIKNMATSYEKTKGKVIR